MSTKKWFILKSEKVFGPYRAHEVIEQVNQGLWNDSRFWAKGQQGWMIYSQALQHLNTDMKNQGTEQQHELLWYYRAQQNEFGPFTFEQLIDQLKKHRHQKGVTVASGAKDEWQEVYQVESLLERLGINRRAHDRVPIDGQILFTDGALQGKSFSIETISQRGLGCLAVKGLSIGEKFKGTIRSNSLAVPLHFQAEVVFLNPNGGLGARFINLSTEAQTHIIAYVKQFVRKHPHIDFKKTA